MYNLHESLKINFVLLIHVFGFASAQLFKINDVISLQFVKNFKWQYYKYTVIVVDKKNNSVFAYIVGIS